MTNEQYKGVLLHWLEDLEEIQKAVEKSGDKEALELVARNYSVSPCYVSAKVLKIGLSRMNTVVSLFFWAVGYPLTE